LLKELRIPLANKAQQKIINDILDKDLKYYNLIPQEMAKKIKNLYDSGKRTEALALHLGYFAGFWSQGRTQYLYYEEESEAFFSGGIASKTMGVLSTWPLRFRAMLSRWLKSGAEGRKSLIRYAFLWTLIIYIGKKLKLNLMNWMGGLSLLRSVFGGGWNAVFGTLQSIVMAIAHGMNYLITKNKFSKLEFNRQLSNIKTGRNIPARNVYLNIKNITTNKYLTPTERILLLFFSSAVNDEIKRKIKPSRKKSKKGWAKSKKWRR